MTAQEIYEILGCKSLYYTGSTANKCIKNPRDTEYFAVFDTYEEAKSAPFIYRVHNISKDHVPHHYYIWGYLFSILNKNDPIYGEKHTFAEPSMEILKNRANYIKNKYPHDMQLKYFYHVAMVEAIDKYGYDEIPEEITDLISDLHDFKITYQEFEQELNK